MNRYSDGTRIEYFKGQPGCTEHRIRKIGTIFRSRCDRTELPEYQITWDDRYNNPNQWFAHKNLSVMQEEEEPPVAEFFKEMHDE